MLETSVIPWVVPFVAEASAKLALPIRLDDATLLQEAMQFLSATPYRRHDCIVKPVSLLQRHFKLGYGSACHLAGELEHMGFWTIGEDTHGMRMATLSAPNSS